MNENNFYDRYYYLTSCGLPYDKKDNWESFFGLIADRIIKDINPQTVLDAGCAYGYLVAALRDRGVEAYGIDISEYAINQVRDDIKPYCEVGSVLDPLNKMYDLIICIEVIEHLTVHESRLAIENLCKNTEDFIFTSTPSDFKEATHFNVQPTEYWARLFSNCDFFRDTDFDASFIINHAIRFRKRQHTFSEIISGYEKSFYRNFIENKTLRAELIETRSNLSHRFNENESSLLAEKNQIISDKDRHIHNLDLEIGNKVAHINERERILKVKEEYIGYLQTEIGQKDEAIGKKDDQLKQMNKDLLDKVVYEKDEHLKELLEQFNQLKLFISSLGINMAEKEEEIRFLTEQNHHHQARADMANDEYMQVLSELTDINEELNKKLISSNNIINDRDRLIHELTLQLNDHRQDTQFIIAQKQDSLKEFERIKSLKGYKLLMKYYKVRDKLLMRNRHHGIFGRSRQAKIPSSVPISQSNPLSENVPDSRGTILQMERKYYSKNPIYNIDFSYEPMISVVVPVYDTPLNVLREMIESVLYQTYPCLELCIVNGSADNTGILACISGYMKTDHRIIYIEVENKGIAENTNAGIKIAKGEFIGLLDHDDILTPNALFEVVSRLQEDSTAHDFFYSDKDTILEDGKTSIHPLYKPNWSPEIMLSANYLTHFCIIRKSLIEKAGFLDSGTDGSQDWDIFLKVIRLTDKICHIPSILYHWRILKTSVASGIGAKPYALNAQLTTLRNHLAALNQKATVDFVSEEKGVIKVDWDAGSTRIVSFVINHTAENYLLKKLLNQIDAFKDKYGYEIDIIILSQPDNVPEKQDSSIRIIKSAGTNIYENLNTVFAKLAGDVILFADSMVSFTDEQSINELVIWAAQKQYGAISPKIVDKKEKILSTGLVINGNSIVDIFRSAKKIEYTIFGYTEWYRNISAVRMECFAIKASVFNEIGYFKPEYHEFSCIEFCLRLLKKGYRHVYNPFSVVQINTLPDLNNNVHEKYYSNLRDVYGIKECDRYWNINLQPASSIPAENKRKLLKLTSSDVAGLSTLTGWEKYSSDALYLANAFDFSTQDFDKNTELMEGTKGYLDIKSVNWFLPHFDFIYYAGLYTIFRFANHLQSVKNVKNTFVIVGGTNAAETYNMIIEAFPLLKNCKVVSMGDISEVNTAPYADASICSLWTTAYYLLRFNRTKRKFYFIQDFEPLFYPAGSTFGQTETTYKFGFYGITNTQGIRKIYEDQYNGKAIDLKPCIDTSIFYPKSGPINLKGKFRVFFYGRPGHPRNGFELGSAALRILKTKLKDKVDIYCAGSEWDPQDYGLGGIVTNIGRMDFEKTADLYRVCDVGLVMMFTKHPSYLPFELMACGCAVVSNYNNDTKWFLKENVNCLLTEATATRIAESIEKLLLNTELRNELVQNAIADIKNNHTSWNVELNAIYDFMCSLENSKEMKRSSPAMISEIIQ